jgi:hypothetical protein
VHWILLTTHQVTNFEGAKQIILWYRQRWNVDICQPCCLHKTQIKINLPSLPVNDRSIALVDFSTIASA